MTTTFRFDADEHVYTDLATGVELPHITGMLAKTGWIDDRWFTEESSARGQAVHKLTADVDLGALDPVACVSDYKGYLLSHAKVMGIVRPHFLSVEEPIVHPLYGFGGRPDRVGLFYGALAVLEGKSGSYAKSHLIQTALQAILAAVDSPVPPEAIVRYAIYWKPNGKAKLEEHTDRRDFDEARRIIRECCGGGP